MTGIGFIGAASILKLDKERDIQGLTAAGIWITAAIGVTIGLGSLGLALLGTVLALIVLTIAERLEFQIYKSQRLANERLANEGEECRLILERETAW